MTLEIIPVVGIGEIVEGDDLARILVAHTTLRDGDIVVVAQKIVSKAEGRLIRVDPADRERARARLVDQETVRLVASRGELRIVETRHGFVCANAGVDASNVPPDRIALLPEDPDASARAIRDGVRAETGAQVGVIVSDTFGRPWRMGQTNVAIGSAGVRTFRDHRGESDTFGMRLEATLIAVTDELAAAAELVMGKSDQIPAAVIRGAEGLLGDGAARELVRPRDEDLFR